MPPIAQQPRASRRRWTWLALLVGCFVLPRTALARTSYTLDKKGSSFVVHLLKGGLASGFAHDHVIIARQFSGTLTIDGSDLATAKLSLQVQTSSLDPDPLALRRAYGMKSKLSASDRKKVLRNLRKKDQLWVSRYPTIDFQSTAIRALGGDRYRIDGKLTLRGVTRAVSLNTTATLVGKQFVGKAQLSVKQSDYGYKPYRAGLGLVRVKDKATINVYLKAKAP
jgi:polyisoprenoid-binding protein YceI